MLDMSLAMHQGMIQGGSLPVEQHTVAWSMAGSLHRIGAQAWGLDPGWVITMQDCAAVSTPLAIKHNLSISQSPSIKEESKAYLEYANGLQ
jgi:hypothetical protein